MIRRRRRKDAPVIRDRAPGTAGLGKRELVRRLAGLGLSTHDDPAIQREGLAIVARFMAWMRAQGSVVSRVHRGQSIERGEYVYEAVIDFAHLTKRGAFGGDFGNGLPLEHFEHAEQEHDADYFARHGIDAEARARSMAVEYLVAHPKDRDWLLEHACDGDVLALASEASQGTPRL